MSAKERLDRPPLPGDAARTYFVARRALGPEVYAVTATDVQRLRPSRRSGAASLDWHESEADRMELARLLIGLVAERRPSRDIEARFAAYVLERLPDDGFTLTSEEISRWLRIAGDTDVVVSGERSRRSWAARLAGAFSGWFSSRPDSGRRD